MLEGMASNRNDDMANLTQEQIEYLSQLMDERLTYSLDELERSSDERYRGAFAGRAPDQLDEALTEMAQAMDDAILKKHIEDVRDITAARKRIAARNYGVCIDCGGEIGYERLLAYPTAKRCIQCQREHEKRKALREGHTIL